MTTHQQTKTKKKNVLIKTFVLLPLLLFSLYILTDDETTSTSSSSSSSYGHHHLAVLTALRRHPPSRRIYRGLSEISLLLLCTSLSLKIWEHTNGLGGDMIGRLLFQDPLEDVQDHDDDDDGKVGNYERVCIEEEETEDTEDTNQSSTTTTTTTRTTTMTSPKPPTSLSIFNATLDLILSILISLFFFTFSSAEGGRYIDGIDSSSTNILKWISGVASPVFPLILFLVVMVRVTWDKKDEKKRMKKGFWMVVSLTVGAPFHEVTFRDGFIGDILTSTIRPLQDIFFTLFYLLSILQGYWSSSYILLTNNNDQTTTTTSTNNNSNEPLPMEHSWILHSMILPGCMISPLWWRFLQNLRQCHDEKERWPYLGNAFKYFLAAEVALFGVFEPNKKESWIWIGGFVLATCYQVLWDVCMDWNLLVLRNDTQLIIPLFRLRDERLYNHQCVYWFIFVINILLRFCWTLSFIPRRYLSRSGLLVDTFSPDFETFVGPALASAEIIRRTLWGLLRVEAEAIKMMRLEEMEKRRSSRDIGLNDDDHHRRMKPMSVEIVRRDHDDYGVNGSVCDDDDMLSSFKPPSSMFSVLRSDMSESTNSQILWELTLYAAAFTSLGIFAAAHRQIM